MSYLRFFYVAAALGAFTASVFAQPSELPVVKTVDLGSILQGSRPPVEISSRPTVPIRAPSVSADQVEWRGVEGKEMARIAALDPIELKTNGNDLRSVLRSIFERAEMKHYIQDGDPVMEQKVTFSTMGGATHVWELLTTLSEIYHLELTYRNGMWVCYVKNDQELVAKSYVLKNNTLERFKSSGNSAPSGGGAGGGSGAGGGGSGASSGSGPSIDRAGQSVFSVDSKALTDEVEKILGVNLGARAVLAGANGSLGVAGARFDTKAEAAKGMVSFLPDSNTLYVVGSRAQHALLEGWLISVDKPIKQIYIETKFLLTSINPTSKIGIHNSIMDKGIGVSLSGLETTVNPERLKSFGFPTAIFSADDLSARLNFMASDSNTTAVQYPQQTTLSGREVVLRSVRQIPIVSTRNRDTGGSSTSTQSEIEFVDVGTVVSILPKVLDEKNVMLSISITVSSISEYVTIDDNPYPVVTSQTYNNQVMVESGYSLALGGLEQTLTSDSNSRIPVLGDIPFFGLLFKDKTKSRSRSVLTMIVTPTVMQGYNGGNTSGIAQHTLAARGTPTRKPFVPSETDGAESVNTALVGFGDDVAEIESFRKEGRFDNRAITRARLLLNELDLMVISLEREEINGKVAKELSSKINTYRKRIVSAMNDKILSSL